MSRKRAKERRKRAADQEKSFSGPMPVVAYEGDGITIYKDAIPELEAALQDSIKHGYEPGITVALYRDKIKPKPKGSFLALAMVAALGARFS